LFNVAQCYRRLGEWSRALAYYRAYLLALPRAPNREQVRTLIGLCEQRMTGQSSGHAARARPPARPPARRRLATRTPAPASKRTSERLVRMEPPQQGPGNRRPWIYAGLALSGALALTGTVTGALALRDSDLYRQPGLDAQERTALRQRGESLTISSTVTFALAGTVAIGTAVLCLLDRRDRARPRAPVSLAPLRGGGGLVVVADRF
jgi:hypothetical protein